MKKIAVINHTLLTCRSINGRMNDKFNRSVKLALMANDLLTKLNNHLEVSVISERSQCALAVKLCLLTGIRIGNEQSTTGSLSIKNIASYGATTLCKNMVTISGNKALLNFTGKKGVKQSLVVTDSLTIEQLKRQLTLNDNDRLFTINDNQIRKFVCRYVGQKFMPKDFRTLYGNCLASEQYLKLVKAKELPKTKRALNAEIKSIYEYVASKLGNTAAICKRAYIDPLLAQELIKKRWN